jgi:hypothetical protein
VIRCRNSTALHPDRASRTAGVGAQENVPVNATLRTMMARAIDYAGLFPPARLPMDAAVAEHLAVLAGPDAWMLGRFVCPAARLDDLAGQPVAPDGGLLVVAALATGGATLAELLENAAEDAEALRAFNSLPGRRAVADQLEVRLPADLLEGPDPIVIRDLAAELYSSLRHAVRGEPLLALEAPVAGEPPETVAIVAAGLARRNAEAVPAGRLPACLKVRCGGLEAGNVPSVEELASALATCRIHGVPIKATQGLHHPFRHHDDALGAPVHGFVNLLSAAILGRAHDLDAGAIGAILAEEDPASFTIDAEGLAWRGLRAAVPEVAAGRRYALIAFGSCSFAEPHDDLVALGLLEE